MQTTSITHFPYSSKSYRSEFQHLRYRSTCISGFLFIRCSLPWKYSETMVYVTFEAIVRKVVPKKRASNVPAMYYYACFSTVSRWLEIVRAILLPTYVEFTLSENSPGRRYCSTDGGRQEERILYRLFFAYTSINNNPYPYFSPQFIPSHSEIISLLRANEYIIKHFQRSQREASIKSNS